MRVLVTGGAGFIGSHVADGLLAAGHEVAIVDDLSTGRRENVPTRATFYEGDIRDAEIVERIFREQRPEIVNHQAAQTSVSVSTREPLRDASINVLGSLTLLEAGVRHGLSRFVFASTGGAIYGEVPEGERASIHSPAAPLSPYACSKRAVELYLGFYAAEHGQAFTVLRYANVYGPRQDPHGEAGVVAIFTERLLAGQPIQINARREPGDDGCVRDYAHVKDVVAANLAAVAGEMREPIVNVGTGTETTTRALADALARACGADVERTYAARRPGDLERSVLEPGPGLPPPTVALAEGLADTVAWFRGRQRGGS